MSRDVSRDVASRDVSRTTHLFNEHVSSDLRGGHVSNLQQELSDPVSDHGKQRHQVFDYLHTKHNLLITSVKTHLKTISSPGQITAATTVI